MAHPHLLAESYTFHDLRAKRASDAEDIMEANEVMAHDDLKWSQAKTSSRCKNIRQTYGY